MTKKVLLSIAGLQFLDAELTEPVEVVAAGDYYCRSGKHYVLYDEPVEGMDGRIQNTIKVGNGVLEVTKKGLTNVHMVFEKDKKNLTCYRTPFGELMVGIETEDLTVRETEENIDVEVRYALEVNYEHMADCTIQMNIKSKDAGDFSLQS